MEIALPGVADGPVHLERDAGGQVGGVGRHRLGHGGVVGEGRLGGGQRPGRPVGGGPGELERHPGVGQVVLHGLEGPDGLAELVALLGVGRGHGHHPIAQPDEKGRRTGGGTVGQQAHGRLGGHAVGQQGFRGQGPMHRGQVPGRAQRRRRLHPARGGRNGVELPARIGVPAGQQQQVGVAGAHHARRAQHAVGRHLARRAHTARADVDATDGEDGIVSNQRGQRGGGRRLRSEGSEGGCGQRGRLEERFGQAGPPRFLEYADQVDVVAAQAAGRLGDHERGRAELGQHGPAVQRLLGAAGGVGQFEGAQRVHVALGVEHGADALAQLVLFLGETEIHGAALQRGRPSSRSPTTLRWISLVPA